MAKHIYIIILLLLLLLLLFSPLCAKSELTESIVSRMTAFHNGCNLSLLAMWVLSSIYCDTFKLFLLFLLSSQAVFWLLCYFTVRSVLRVMRGKSTTKCNDKDALAITACNVGWVCKHSRYGFVMFGWPYIYKLYYSRVIVDNARWRGMRKPNSPPPNLIPSPRFRWLFTWRCPSRRVYFELHCL